MPSRRHELLAYLVPRLKKSGELVTPEHERARIIAWHNGLDRSLPTKAVPRFGRRFSVVRDDSAGFPTYVITPRHVRPTRTLFYVHGGAYNAPIDAFHVRYATLLARAVGARVVMPDYPLAPEHTWRDSFDAMTTSAARWAEEPMVLTGDSAGGGYALALALALRDRGGPQPTHLVLHAPWVDLTTSTPETETVTLTDPWLFIGKVRAYAEWWAGSPEDLGRPEVSPVFGSLAGLPPALLMYGTRDTIAPGCRLLTARSVEDGWDLSVIEEPGFIHVYSLLPFVPEARRAFRQTIAFLG
ncbi:alpha/beta hydrolase [Nocardioides sp. InS609-2]|uniref:alpha/beta hydrolase n=1 Tax=Nocardioides sp. InS609-2 TaxID=2760705 RepID=UPI0020C0D2AB|nr:alpha/beta hydrolase [Nocardioides sp. InS609-2]